MSWKFICPSNCPLVTSRPPPPSLPPSALIIRDRTLPFPSLRFHFRDVGVVESGGEEEANWNEFSRRGGHRSAIARPVVERPLSRDRHHRNYQRSGGGQTRFRRVFFYAERTTFHTDDDTGGNEPLCFPPSLLTTAILFLPPYTRAHPFASLNLHYFNVALCPTLPFLSIGSTRALLNFQFQFLFLLSRLFLFAVHLQTLESPLSSFYGR